MYILFGAILFVIILLFGSTLFKLITSNTPMNYQSGTIWFVSLLLINIIIVSFLYYYTNYKANIAGDKGKPGPAGISGRNGEDCKILEEKCINYIPLNTYIGTSQP